MRLLHSGVLFLVVLLPYCFSADTDHTNGEDDDFQVYTAVAKVYDATDPPVAACKNGIVGALLQTFGTSLDEFPPGILNTLSKLTGGLAASPPATASTSYSAQDPLALFNASLAPPFVASYANDLSEITQSVSGVFASLLGLNFLATSTVPSHHHLIRKLMETFNVSDEEISTTASKRHLADAGSLLSSLPEQFLLYLTSRTFSKLLDGVIGITKWRNPPASPPALFADFSLTSPMLNLVDAFCSAASFSYKEDVVPKKRVCLVLNILWSVLACREDSSVPTKLQCSAAQPASGAVPITYAPPAKVCKPKSGPHKDTVVKFDEYFDLQLTDLLADGKLLPDTLEESLLHEDGLTLYFLLRSTFLAADFAQLPSLCGLTKPLQDFVPGWKTFASLFLGEEGDILLTRTKKHTPFAHFAKPPPEKEAERCRILITLRPTARSFEWKINGQTPLAPFLKDDVKAHGGITSLTYSIASTVTTIIGQRLDEVQCSSKDSMDIIVTGMSLGAGVGTLLSLYIKEFFGDSVRVSMAAFAAPSLFNKEGATYFKERVNARMIGYDMDPIAVGPCTVDSHELGMPRCAVEGLGVINTAGLAHDSIFDSFVRAPGFLRLPFAELSGPQGFNMTYEHARIIVSGSLAGTSLTGNLSIEARAAPPLQVAAGHMCSYSCKFSKFCDEDYEWMCRSPALYDAEVQRKTDEIAKGIPNSHKYCGGIFQIRKTIDLGSLLG